MNSCGNPARRTVLATALGFAGGCVIPAVAADRHPSRDIRLIVPFTPAGATDLLARGLADALARRTGDRVVIDNRPGAGGNLGAELGPTLNDVGKRLQRAEIVESVMDPNAKVDARYYAVNITTRDGDEFSGLIAGEDAQAVTLRMGAEITRKIEKRNITARETLKTSGMPDGLAATLSAQEFVDVIEFLAAQK